MDHDFVIYGQGTILKPLTEQDIEPLRLLRNKPANRQWFINKKIITSKEQAEWFGKYLMTEDDITFSIVKQEAPDIFIGAVSLYNITSDEAEFGRFLIDSENPANRGFAFEVVKAIITFAVEALNLKKVYLSVYKENAKAIHIYKKAGFTDFCYSQQTGMIFMEIKNK